VLHQPLEALVLRPITPLPWVWVLLWRDCSWHCKVKGDKQAVVKVALIVKIAFGYCKGSPTYLGLNIL
jgi:hypothetical protein